MPIEPKELVAKFVSAVQSQNECIENCNPKRGNKFAMEYNQAGMALLSGGEQAINEFAELLSHDDLSVRVTAGAYLLEARTKEVVATLKPISRGKGLAALGAYMTLERYKRGELRLQ